MSAEKVALGRRLFFETRLSSTGHYAGSSCHRPELSFTDGRAHALGATGESVRRGAMRLAHVAYKAAFTWGNAKVRSVEPEMRQPLCGQGVVEVHNRAAEMGKFRVPRVRNVALTAPYMHDGSLPSLDAVLDHYVQGGHKSPRQDSRIRPIVLSEAERADLLAFLGSLTDREFVENSELSAPKYP